MPNDASRSGHSGAASGSDQGAASVAPPSPSELALVAPLADATTESQPSTRLALAFPLGRTAARTVAERGGQDRAYDAIIIKAGVYSPGIGADGKRVRLTKALLQRLHKSLDGKMVNLEHSRAPQDEVGVITHPHMVDDAVRGTLVLQSIRPRFGDAMGFVEGRLQANRVPNVSVEFLNPVYVMAPAHERDWDLDLVHAESMDGCAILGKGACSDPVCGIGLNSADITVLALQGIDTKEQTHMCDQKELVASLQAKVTALEADAKTKEAELVTLRADKASLANDHKDATTRVAAYEAAEKDALRVALEQAAPAGTNFKDVLGMELKDAEAGTLSVALRAFKATGATKAGFTAGRRTAPGARDAETAAGDLRVALAAKHGITMGKESKLPARLQRNTEKLLASLAPEGAQ